MPRIQLIILAVAFIFPNVAAAQSGSFIVPRLRGSGPSAEFAYWDLFARPPASVVNSNFNHPNPPALLDGFGEDDEGNETQLFAPRAVLLQTGTPTAFVTSSGAIYSFSAPLRVEVRYQPPSTSTEEVANVIFQTQSGGARLNLNSVVLIGANEAGETVEVLPVFKALDDPQTGAFSERIVSAFQWNLEGLGIRAFSIHFDTPTSMPLWQAQLDVVRGQPFQQELGYLLNAGVRPVLRFGRPGRIDRNLPSTLDSRYFLEGQALELLADPDSGWMPSGWLLDGQPMPQGPLPFHFPAQDVTARAVFYPINYQAWRTGLFFHFNAVTGTQNDYLDDTISAPDVDWDGDELRNDGEYVFGGDPYTMDAERTTPVMLLISEGTDLFAALRYRTNGTPNGSGGIERWVQVSRGGGSWEDNRSSPTTSIVTQELQPDGSLLITERALIPLQPSESTRMRVFWSVDGQSGPPLETEVLTLNSAPESLQVRVGELFELPLSANGGVQPYQWNVQDGALPTGLQLLGDGTIVGRPDQAGPFSAILQVTDAVGTSLTVDIVGDVLPFEILTLADLGASRVSEPLSVSLAAVGGNAPLVWELTAGTQLPDGLQLGADGVLTGTPEGVWNGSFSVEVRDADSRVRVRSFQLKIVDLLIVSSAELPVGYAGLAFEHHFQANGGSAPLTWSLDSGALPQGLALTSQGQVGGVPLSAGVFNFRITVTDGSGVTAEQDAQLEVFADIPTPVMLPWEPPPTRVGTGFRLLLQASYDPDRFQVVGLPRGLSLNTFSGEITGRVSGTGRYPLRARAHNLSGWGEWSEANWFVIALPDSTRGGFIGLVPPTAASNDDHGGILRMRISDTGVATLELREGRRRYRARSLIRIEAPHLMLSLGGRALAVTFDEEDGFYSGTWGDANLQGWRLGAVEHDEIGFYGLTLSLTDEEDLDRVDLPQGHGILTATVRSDGRVHMVGRTGEGGGFTGSSAMLESGRVPLFLTAQRGRSSLRGDLDWEGARALPERGIAISGSVYWSKLAGGGAHYPGGFDPVSVTAAGGWLRDLSRRSVVQSLPKVGAIDLRLTRGGIEESEAWSAVNPWTGTWDEQRRRVIPSAVNPARLSLQVSPRTGLIRGRLNLEETTPPLRRSGIRFLGLMAPGLGSGVLGRGAFHLRQIPDVGQTFRSSPVLSGSLELSQDEHD